MKIKKVLLVGFISGLIMGIALFLSGAIASRIVYGPQMVPEGKFEPDQINAFYFFWTKLVLPENKYAVFSENSDVALSENSNASFSENSDV